MPELNHAIHSRLGLELPCQADHAYLEIVFPVGGKIAKSCVSQSEIGPGERRNPVTP